MELKKTYFCPTCRMNMDAKNFYKSNNLEKYGENDGFLFECKKCITLGIDPWNPDTFKEKILKEADVPWIPDEWSKVLTSSLNGPKKPSNTALIGKYLSKMRINQNKEFRWKDTEFLQERRELQIRETMKRQGFEAAEIEKAIMEGHTPMPEKPESMAESVSPGVVASPRPQEEDLGLTEEDKNYLKIKWGRTYRPVEWIQLERLYNDMMNSYDIQLAGHENDLKLVCKASLTANKLIDLGDVDGFTKAAKAYNDLMKSGKFTAAQNKQEQGEYIDSISELVMICESDGFIPRFYTDEPKDRVDRVIQDLQGYTKSLILEETNLGEMLDTALHQIQEDNEKASKISTLDEDENEAMLAKLDALLFSEENAPELTDEDYEVYYNFKNGDNDE